MPFHLFQFRRLHEVERLFGVVDEVKRLIGPVQSGLTRRVAHNASMLLDT
jgi:hypothetical protein